MRTREEIQSQVQSSIKTLTQPACLTVWGKERERVCPEPIKGSRDLYDKETQLIVEVLLDIRDYLAERKTTPEQRQIDSGSSVYENWLRHDLKQKANEMVTPLFKASDIINLGYNLNFRSEEAAEQAREALLKISK